MVIQALLSHKSQHLKITGDCLRLPVRTLCLRYLLITVGSILQLLLTCQSTIDVLFCVFYSQLASNPFYFNFKYISRILAVNCARSSCSLIEATPREDQMVHDVLAPCFPRSCHRKSPCKSGVYLMKALIYVLYIRTPES